MFTFYPINIFDYLSNSIFISSKSSFVYSSNLSGIYISFIGVKLSDFGSFYLLISFFTINKVFTSFTLSLFTFETIYTGFISWLNILFIESYNYTILSYLKVIFY